MSEFKKQTDGDFVVFTPVAGWTINHAIVYSIDLAKLKHRSVQIDMNDIILKVDENSNVSTVKNLYLKLLNERYEKLK